MKTKKILIVDDDVLVSSIYRSKLQAEGYEVEVVEDGESALAFLKSRPPQLVLLDLGLPTINGLSVLKAIRSNLATATLPVVVLSNAYATALIEAAWKAGANECLSKASTTPRLLLDVIHRLLPGSVGLPEPLAAQVESVKPAPVPAKKIPAPEKEIPRTPVPEIVMPVASDSLFQSRVQAALLSHAPGLVEDLRKRLRLLARQNPADQTHTDLADFYRAVHSLTGHAASAGFTSIAHLCAALEALIKELQDKPKKIGPSPLRTAAQAVDSLVRLFEQERLQQITEPLPPLVLVLDDDVLARRTLCVALDKARLRSISVDDPVVALRLLEENACDLIFSDVEMPNMNGYEFCTKVRALKQHRHTPVIFVTSASDFENLVQSTLSGGNDLIAKPFLLVELAVKALTHVLQKPSVSNHPSPESK